MKNVAGLLLREYLFYWSNLLSPFNLSTLFRCTSLQQMSESRYIGTIFAFRMEGQEVLNVLVGGTLVSFSFLLGGRLSFSLDN